MNKTTRGFYQKGNEAIGVLVILGLVILFMVWILGFNFGHTYTGTVDTADCRANVELNQGDWTTYWHKFYCADGYCEAVSMSGDQCDTSYSYTQSSNTQ